MTESLYLIETKDHVWWSPRKLTAQYKHVEFLLGRAKYKEMEKEQFLKYRSKSPKTFYKLEEA